VCFFGEGALGQGLLYEVMNMASLWKLPVVYVCENNLYNEYTHFHETTAGSVSARAEAFGLPAGTVDGQDVRAVRGAALEAVERARRGDGPSFLICETYRLHGHHVGDVDRAYYRSRDEEATWREQRDPIALHGAWLLEQGLAGEHDLTAAELRVRAAVEAGVAFALAAPYPAAEEVDQHVYA
jgi:pyruvate dehydrogenase E1 component alpha subunit